MSTEIGAKAGTQVNHPLILAHRGASAEAPENTMPAFELALRQGADGIELDVQLSSDGVAVVTHDEDCRRLTGEPGAVGAMSLRELKARNFAAHQPQAGFVTLPTLEEVLDWIQPSCLMLNIELKNSETAYPGLEQEVLRLVVQHRMAERVLLSSFNHCSVARLAEMIREQGLPVRCGLLYARRLVRPWERARRIGAVAIHPLYRLARGAGMIERAHQAGIAVYPWTVDDTEDLICFFRLGVDAVITNWPARAVLLRGQPDAGGD